jgi:hypothetical protein
MELNPGQKVDLFYINKPVNGNPMQVLKVISQVLNKNWKRALFIDSEGIRRAFKHYPFIAKPHFEKFIIM